MTTQNIISTPNITGNVGSCNTDTKQVIVDSKFMRDTGFTVATNSCTGDITQYPYHSLNGGAYIGVFGIFIIIIVFLISWGNRGTCY